MLFALYVLMTSDVPYGLCFLPYSWNVMNPNPSQPWRVGAYMLVGLMRPRAAPPSVSIYSERTQHNSDEYRGYYKVAYMKGISRKSFREQGSTGSYACDSHNASVQYIGIRTTYDQSTQN